MDLTYSYRTLAKIIINVQQPYFKENPWFQTICYAWDWVSPNYSMELGWFANECHEKGYSWEYIKTINQYFYDCNQFWPCINFKDLVDLFPYQSLDDSSAIENICRKVMEEQPHAVADYKKGKLNSINHLKGQVMKATGGKINVKIVNETLQRLLSI